MDYYTLEQVKRNEYWIVIQDNVYDISSYIARNLHPGGNEVLLKYLGNDATQAFKNIHSTKAWNDLEEFRIGKVYNSYSINYWYNMLFKNKT